MEFSTEEVSLYLEAVGLKLMPDAAGMLHIPCPFASSGPSHEIVMNGQTGSWTDQGDHGRGGLADFALGWLKLCDFRMARDAVQKTIQEVRQAKRQAEEARRASRDKQVEDLPRSVRSLLRIIDEHPEGIARRSLKQRSHMRQTEAHLFPGLRPRAADTSRARNWHPQRVRNLRKDTDTSVSRPSRRL